MLLSALAPSLLRRSLLLSSASVFAASPLRRTAKKFQMSTSTAANGGKTNPNPPPDASRGATADLCDVHYPDPVDVLPDPSKQKEQIAEPVFR